jgi:hypothetical protein
LLLTIRRYEFAAVSPLVRIWSYLEVVGHGF